MQNMYDDPVKRPPQLYAEESVADPVAGKVRGSEDALEERPEQDVEGGARYQGQWLGAHRHGKGILSRSDGQRYEGYFANSQAQGYGVFFAANGNRYEGQWDEDRAHGKGKYIHTDGSTYEGDWQHDEKS